jgi:hypothetical protein
MLQLVALILTAAATIVELLRNYSPTTTIVLVTAFTGLSFCLILAFLMYDRHMQGTNNKIANNAAKSTEFVSSMFPANMHQRLFDSSLAYLNSDEALNNMGDDDGASASENGLLEPHSTRRDSGVQKDANVLMKSKPIAELYPETTIMVRNITHVRPFNVPFSQCLLSISTSYVIVMKVG